MVAEDVEARIMALRDAVQAAHLMRFFKCGEGEYGCGDMFLGVRVPQTRAIVREYRKEVQLDDTVRLIASPWHEVRLAGFLLMVELYNKCKRASDVDAKRVVACYTGSLDCANNWDLVDLSAPYILGDWLVQHSEARSILYQLADMDGRLWHQRVAIVATWMLIRHGEFNDSFNLAEKYLTHGHDLIHKATGWMLREVGKRGGMNELRAFIDRYVTSMPRTMLRYAIEKFAEEDRKNYLRFRRNRI